MIEKISAINLTSANSNTAPRGSSYNIHNMSPNEMDQMTLEMFNRGEISLKERLPFVPLPLDRLSQELGQEIHLKYYSRVWDDPNRKRDMLSEFESILRDQVRDSDIQQNISSTQSAISLLKQIEQKQSQSFESILQSSMTKKH